MTGFRPPGDDQPFAAPPFPPPPTAGPPPYREPAPYAGPPPTGLQQPQPQWQPMQAPNPYLQMPPYNYGYPPAAGRPGTTIAAGVLGYITAGLLIFAGIFLLFGASLTYSANLHHGYSGELAVDGLANMIAAGLLIGGGVAMTGRSATGRVLYSVGTAIVLVEAIYWIARLGGASNGSVVVWALFYSALVIIGVSMAWTRSVTAWLRGIG